MSDTDDLRRLKADAERVLAQAEAWLSITAYAEKYAVSRRTVYKWIDCGLVDAFKVERVIRLKDFPPRRCA